MNTLIVLGEGLLRYLGWWLMALLRWRDPAASLGPRRLAFLLAAMPFFLAVQLIHSLCLLLDEVLFPRYRNASLAGAVVITGVPRSGTTFLHRTLAADRDTYTTLTTWEALLAPSIVQRRLVGALRGLDRALGGPLARMLAALTRRISGGMAHIHEVGLAAAEEDYFVLLPAGGCFIMTLAFPAAAGLRALGAFDQHVPERRRRRLLRFYHGCLQRHIYADGGQRRLLSKNAAFGSWLGELRSTLPEARFIVCLRPPEAALSSQISAVAPARRLFGVATEEPAFQQIFVDFYAETLAHMAWELPSWPGHTAAIVDVAALQQQPAQTIRAIMGRLGLPETAAIAAAIEGLPDGGGRSDHRHSLTETALDRATVQRRLEPPYRRLLSLSHCVGTPS